MMKNLIVFFMVFCAWKANAQCIVSEPASTFLCQGSASSATFTLSAPTATAYDWQQLNSATSTWSSLVNGANYAGVATNAMTVSGLNTTPASFSFRCIVSNGATACDTSVTVILTIRPKPVLTISGNNSVCSGTSNNISLTLSNSLGAAGSSYSWSRASMTGITPSTSTGTASSISETLVSTNSAGSIVTYNVTTTTNACTSDPIQFQVTVKPKPVLTIIGSNNVCSGTTNNIGLTLSSNLGSATYNWSRASVSGISPSISSGTSSSITESLVNTNTTGTIVTYNATTTTNGCSSDTGSLQVTVKPKPTLTNSGSISVCSGTANNVNLTLNSNLGSATYSWSRLSVSGITPSTNSGSSSSISETLINSSSSQIPVGYTAFTTTNGCTSDQLSITITVKPKPLIASTSVTICSSNGILVTPTDGVGGDIVPSNTVYSWAAPSNANLTGITSGSGLSNFSQLLTNISGGNQSLTYTVTPTAGTCTGASFNINVTVKNEPTPQIIAAQSICPGESVQLFVNGGATYNWSPNTNINATFINNPTVSPTATTTYTAQVIGDNGCSVSPTVLVTVQSLPTITNIAAAGNSVCSGGTYNFTPSVASGTTYQWTRNNNGAYSANTGIGTSPISNVLSSDLAAPTAVTYNFSLTNSAGCTNSQSINVVVNPLPQITNHLDVPSSICSNEAFSFSPVSLPASSFSWSRVLPTSVSSSNPGSGSSAITNHTFVNSSNTPQWVEYNFTLTSNNGSCTSSQTLGLWVQPSISLISSTVAVCSGSELNYFPQLSNNLNDVTVFWTRNTLTTGLSSTGSIQGQGMITQVISNNSNGALTTAYNLTGYYNGCSSDVASLNVTVNPIPVISKSNVVQSVCSNSSWTTNLNSSMTSGTNNYIWTSIPNPILSLQSGSLSGTNSMIAQSWANGTSDILEVGYTAQVTNNGCTSSPLTWTIEVKPIPVLTNLPVGSAICSGESFVFEPSWTIPGTTYTWNRTSPSPASGTTTINEVLYSSSQNTVNANYSILGSSLGCSSLSSIFSVAINPLPIAASISQFTFCNDEFANVVLTDWNGYDVSWYPANLFSDFQSENTTYIGSESSVVSAQAQNNYGCTIEQSFAITIGDPLDASFTWEGGICQGNEIIVNANNPNYDVYAWILNGIDISDAGSTSFSLGASDEIELVVQDENGCLATMSQIIVGVANPQNQIFGSDILCQNQTNVTFNALAIEGNLHWTIENGVLVGGQGYSEAVFNFGQGDQAFVYLESTNNEGCSSTDTLVISLTGQADSSFSIYLLGISTLVHPDSTFEIYRWGKTGIVSGIEESWTTDFQYYNYSLVDVTQNYYWVETTNAEGCTTRSYYNEPVVPNGVVNKGDVSIKFYPNPTNDGILFFNGNQNLEVALFDSMGQLVFNGSSDGVIDLSKENSGLYYIVYKEQGISRTQKLIKL